MKVKIIAAASCVLVAFLAIKSAHAQVQPYTSSLLLTCRAVATPPWPYSCVVSANEANRSVSMNWKAVGYTITESSATSATVVCGSLGPNASASVTAFDGGSPESSQFVASVFLPCGSVK
jgi:hypothetical protein